ncbi:Granulocyte-macrophage colony-stimulating factor receptor subunit alpha [Microtus ochrogaster]|uniref:Granulocyte-macrophage colony-stimulating factor receptor subunit alpha n=1 Tax=Microtus ochrogaster TaxID=79684 RepID=A0A8J6FXJ7_MICOH|nr:Granulocyte-macrophage colony-stimulating factor receptor subunit alpha [Microtus ochrogaster]
MVTSCYVNFTLHGRPTRRRMQNTLGCRCQFRALTLHLGVTLGVNATSGNVTIHERLDYIFPGPPGSEAVNVSCEIHDAAAMTCTWEAGPAAPPDARYFLVLRNTTGHKLPGCPSGPALSGCRINDLTGLLDRLHVTVAGWSQSGGALRAYDVILNTKAIERLSPPSNITGSCNASHCAVSWVPPRTWATMGFADFRYELDLRRTVRTDRPTVPRLPVYIIAMAVTLTCVLGLALAWRRFIWHRLLPRIPDIQDKVSDNALVNPQVPVLLGEGSDDVIAHAAPPPHPVGGSTQELWEFQRGRGDKLFLTLPVVITEWYHWEWSEEEDQTGHWPTVSCGLSCRASRKAPSTMAVCSQGWFLEKKIGLPVDLEAAQKGPEGGHCDSLNQRNT